MRGPERQMGKMVMGVTRKESVFSESEYEGEVDGERSKVRPWLKYKKLYRLYG